MSHLSSGSRPEISRNYRSAFWILLALGGQAATLHLTAAGASIGYQHLATPLTGTGPEHRWALAFIVVQTLLVGLGWRRRLSAAWAWLRQRFSPWTILGVLGIVGATSATVSRDPTVYLTEVAFATFLQGLALATVALAVLALSPSVLGRGRDWLSAFLHPRPGPRLDRVVLVSAIWVVCFSAVLALLSYQRHPHIPDEVSYLLQAKYFAAGQLAMPLPQVPDAFRIDLMTYEPNRWYSPFPPGWPAMLALGVMFGAAWLVNPLLSGIGVVLAYIFVRDLYDRGVARTVAVLMAVSPWYVFMAMSFMAHTFTTVIALLAAIGVSRLRSSRRLAWALLGGAGIGIVSINRPLEGLILAGVLGLWVLVPTGVGQHLPGRLGRLIGLAAATAGAAALVFPYNAHLTGRPLYFPVMAYADRVYGVGTNALGFGPNRGFGWPGLDPFPGHGLIDVIINANMNLFAVNVELYGWATGSLILVAFFLFSRRIQGPDWLMIAMIVTTMATHSLYWFSGGPDFGARYWYLIIVPCLVLSARGLGYLAGEAGEGNEGGSGSTMVYAGVAILIVVALATFFPWRATDKYFHYRGMEPGIRQLDSTHGFGRSVVFIRGRQFPDYASAAAYNPIDANSDDPLYVWGQSDDLVAAVRRAFPDRPVWFVDGPTVTGGGYRLVEHPAADDNPP